MRRHALPSLLRVRTLGPTFLVQLYHTCTGMSAYLSSPCRGTLDASPDKFRKGFSSHLGRVSMRMKRRSCSRMPCLPLQALDDGQRRQRSRVRLMTAAALHKAIAGASAPVRHRRLLQVAGRVRRRPCILQRSCRGSCRV